MAKRILKTEVWLLAIVLAIATCFYHLSNQCELGYTFDSFLYLETSAEIEWNDFWATPGFYLRPPLYPLLISTIGSDFLYEINLICLWGILTILVIWSNEMQHNLLRMIFLAMMIVATPLYLIHAFVWSEPLFVLVLMAAFFMLHRYWQYGQTYALIWSCLLFALLPAIRFAGLFIILPVFLWVLYFLPRHLKGVLFGFAGLFIVMVLLWSIKYQAGFINLWESHFSPVGTALISEGYSSMDSYLEAMSAWVIPHSLPKLVRYGVGIFILTTMLIWSANRLRSGFVSTIEIIPLCFLIYLLCLLPLYRVEFDTSERYLIPFYPLLIYVFFWQVDRKYDQYSVIQQRVLISICTVWVSYGAIRTGKNLILWQEVRCSNSYANMIKTEKKDFEKSFQEINSRIHQIENHP